MERNRLLQQIERLPREPGVYLFKDVRGEILYVGKAADLHDRVYSYLRKSARKDGKTLSMMEKVAGFDFLITDTEKEALILEDNLIKEHHPRYNIKFRDDKHYPYLKISPEENPALSIVRRVQRDRSLYFGPYPSAAALRETIKVIRRIFPISTSLDTKFTPRLRLGPTGGPAWGAGQDPKVPARSRSVVQQVRMFLEGKNQGLIRQMRKKMREEAGQMNFEAAARIRDQIKNIEKVVERQRIVSRGVLDRDVLAFCRKDHTVTIYLLFIRGGKILGGKEVSLPLSELPDEEILGSFLRQYYREGNFIPREILIPRALPDQSLTERWLTEKKRKKVRILIPRRGERKNLLEMARENAARSLPP